ncbi:hypothetical protein GGR05_002756 [Aureimonas phyllosphaerae]|uniref:DUF4169 domain-containing protein n=1 Tax=Aureimonas phyllosphaerae TaxID=1166078 RepID=A0A7W6FW08_9HYPH|nr:DUF4169 family protein [Aureimonas phyllosphaerae]MBB3936602.1 hypothetical protein [Aureimonas phyllosphaerae]MBB3960534.1 hypothetical protein [Aureimonas phyllosphaerae]
MGDVINLRLARKRAARAADAEVAERNRARHGIAKPEREMARREAERAERLLDAARRDPSAKHSRETDDPTAP